MKSEIGRPLPCLSTRHSKPNTQHWRSGFTLLELTISIVLLATIVLIIGGAVRLGYRSVNSGERKAADLERLRASLSIIDAQIESWLPLKVDEGGVTHVYFEGTARSIKLATNYSVWTGRKGYVLVEYRVGPDEKGRQALYVSERLVGGMKARETKLLRNFDRIYFEYFVRETTEVRGRWVLQWADPTTPPLKIMVRLASGGNEVAIIIPLRAQPSLINAAAGISRSAAEFLYDV